MRLKDKIAVVTGAGNGLGRGIALAFAEQGATVVAVDKNATQGLKLLAVIQNAGGNGSFIQTDISSLEEVQRCFAETEKQFGRLDILVNNAGITGRSIGDGPVDDCLVEAWDQIMDVNLRGTFLCCKYGLKLMLPRQKGVLINMSSVLGLVGCHDYFTSHAYQTTKAGIIGLTRSISAYYAKYGIRCNALAPGLIASNATEKVTQNEEIMLFTQRMQPLGNIGTPRDVAQAAVYLASDESTFVTGQVLAIDGGWTVQ